MGIVARWTGRFGRVGFAVLALALAFGLFAASAQPTAAAYDCSCVRYVMAQTGLPGGYMYPRDYQPKMDKLGWREVSYRDIKPGKTIVIWEPNVKGADNVGHMGIANGVTYDAKAKKYTVAVSHVNWAKNCNVTSPSFTWPDLNGLHFYVKK